MKAAIAAEPFFVLEFKFCNLVGGEQRDDHVDARSCEGLNLAVEPIAATGTGHDADESFSDAVDPKDLGRHDDYLPVGTWACSK